MKLFAVDIPEDAGTLRVWLERHLMGADLAAVVAELKAVQSSRGGDVDLQVALGGELEAVLEEGLTGLSAAGVRRLFAQPELLLELQERILLEGGSYWQRPASLSSELDEWTERGWNKLSSALSEDARAPALPDVSPVSTPAQRWHHHPAWFALATAASLLAVVLLYQQRTAPGTAVAWGWNKPVQEQRAGSGAEYLTSLADSAQEWFNKRPSDPPAVAQRISEFRQGCSMLLLSEHKPLAPADKVWLLERCRAWAGKLDAQLAAIEGGGDPLAVRSEVDDIARKLIQALQERAEQVQSDARVT